MKILFLYVPATAGGGRGDLAVGPMVMPLGFPALADMAARMGHQVELRHCGLERAVGGKFDIAAAAGGFEPDVIALSLHFHHQLAEVGKAVELLKAAAPGASIVLGGLTASFFYDDIIRKWPAVDFVIRGDGEAPLYQLIQALDGGNPTESLFEIPNLVFRLDGRLIKTGFSYTGEREVLDRLVFSNLSLLKNSEMYGGSFLWTETGAMAEYCKNRYHYICGGRGCSVSCAYCAGASSSQAIISNRPKPAFRSAEKLSDEISELASMGKDRFYICFDPPGRGGSPYLEMMRLLRERGAGVGMVFEAYGKLPADSFLRDFSETFPVNGSALVFSPATVSEERRKFYNGKFWKNKQLESKLAKCTGMGIPSKLYFTVFPDENMADVKRSAGWAERLSESFGSETVFMPIEMEPGAPWHLSPKRYGIVPLRKTFEDFIENSRANGYRTAAAEPGYEFPGFEKKMDYLRSRGLAV